MPRQKESKNKGDNVKKSVAGSVVPISKDNAGRSTKISEDLKINPVLIPASPLQIILLVATVFDIDPVNMMACRGIKYTNYLRGFKDSYVQARMVAQTYIYKYCKMGVQELGKIFKQANHTAIYHSIIWVNERKEAGDKKYAPLITAIEEFCEDNYLKLTTKTRIK